MAGTLTLDREIVPARRFQVAEAVKWAAEKHRRPYPQIAMEVASAMFGPGKVRPEEYFQMRMFDVDVVPRDQLRAFCGRRTAYFHNMAANDLLLWRELSEDKLAFDVWLGALGLPVPELVAAYHPTRTLGRMARSLSDRAALAGFLADESVYPLFMKPNSLSWSVGTASLASTDGTTVTDLFGRTATVDELAGRIAEMGLNGGFLFQRTTQNHPDLVALCGRALATVRVFVMRDADGPRILRTHIKLPTGDNVADNTWRAGNLAVGVDLETGALGRSWIGKGIDAVACTEHPDTKASLEVTLPLWDQVKAVALEAAGAIDGLRIIGFDIAIAPSGPVIVEANSDPDWEVSQRLTGRGMLDDAFVAFLDACKKNPRKSDR
ncbi:MAG: sugar-transfer associated ATP-grasp domain-containing protein [Myxococcota bacterium]